MDRQTPPQALLFPAEVMQNFASQPEVQLRAMKRLLRMPEQQLGREPVRPFPAQEMPHSTGLWGALPLPHAPPQCPHSVAPPSAWNSSHVATFVERTAGWGVREPDWVW